MKTSVYALSASGKERRIRLLELSGAKWVGFGEAVFDVRPPSGARRAQPDWIRSVVDRITRSGFESAVRQLVSYRTRYSAHEHSIYHSNPGRTLYA
ncbi:MAG TPA: hypothetical protein P5186_03960 [Candidatus Paceibacterota bacterium]|nr:hypothetical protein [Verrucomicrobiota bacterium]HRY47183.1 hypothetical protein [Candidatus Paceibacterota bacterium]HSA02930.1 hypothetical protein [Candidatus Paceibacterota bacterium]